MPGRPTTLTPAHWPLHKYGRNGSTLRLWGCKSFLCPVTVKYMSGAGPSASLVNLRCNYWGTLSVLKTPGRPARQGSPVRVARH